MPRKSTDNSSISLLKFFSPIQKNTKNDRRVSDSNPFNKHFLPFNVTKTMSMAPINRFQHPVPPNFADIVCGDTRNSESNSVDTRCNSSIPQKTKNSEKYIKEFLSTVRPELLKKRGVKPLVSVKELMQQTAKFETINNMDIDYDNNNECESMDWTNNRSGTITRDCSFLSASEMSVDDLSSLFRDNRKIWMKLLQFEENYRPPYYGTWSKSSPIISGRRPFAKDTSILDYEYDSDMEWEEEEEGEELKSDDDDDDPEEEDPRDDDWIVPTGYLSEDEIIGEADESASVASSESSSLKKKTGNYKEYNQHRVIEPLRPIVIGPIFEEHLGDSNHQLAEYSTKLLNVNIMLPYDPFAIPITNKRKAKGSGIEDAISCDKEKPPIKSRSKGKSSQKNKDQAKSNEVKQTANIANDNGMLAS